MVEAGDEDSIGGGGGGDGRVMGVRRGRAAVDRAGALSVPVCGCLAYIVDLVSTFSDHELFECNPVRDEVHFVSKVRVEDRNTEHLMTLSSLQIHSTRPTLSFNSM